MHPRARFAAAKPLGGVCCAAIPAHTTSFGHISLKSRWPLSSRSSSPPGTCRSPIPPDGARGARAARGLAPRSHRTAFCHHRTRRRRVPRARRVVARDWDDRAPRVGDCQRRSPIPRRAVRARRSRPETARLTDHHRSRVFLWNHRLTQKSRTVRPRSVAARHRAQRKMQCAASRLADSAADRVETRGNSQAQILGGSCGSQKVEKRRDAIGQIGQRCARD